MRILNAEQFLLLVKWVQLKNHRAYLAHRRKKLRETDGET